MTPTLSGRGATCAGGGAAMLQIATAEAIIPLTRYNQGELMAAKKMSSSTTKKSSGGGKSGGGKKC